MLSPMDLFCCHTNVKNDSQSKADVESGMINLVAKAFTANNIAKATYIVQSVGRQITAVKLKETWGTTAVLILRQYDFMAGEFLCRWNHSET